MWSHSTRLLAAVFSVFAAQTVFLILLPLSMVEAGHSPSVALSLISLLGLLGLFTDIPVAAVSDRYGRFPIVAGGGFVTCASGLVLGSGDGRLLESLAGVLLYSLGLSMTFAPLLAMLTEVGPPDRQLRIQGANGAIQGAATVAGAAAAGLLAQLDSQTALYGIALLGVVISVSVFGIGVHERPLGMSAVARSVLNGLLPTLRLTSRSGVRAAMLVSGLYATGFLVVGSSLLPLILVAGLTVEPWAIGLLLASRNVVAAAASLTFPLAVRHAGLRRSVLGTQIASLGGIASLAPALVLPWALPVSLLLQGLGASYAAAAANTLAANATSPSERAAGLAATTVASRLALLLGPVALSVLIAESGHVVALLATALVGCVGFTGLVLVTRSAGHQDNWGDRRRP